MLMARAGPVLLVLLLLVPSANYQVFDGLPLSRVPEFVALALLIPLLVSRALRRLHARWTGRWPRIVKVLAVAAGAGALGAKLLLLASGTHQGFLACYQTPLDPPTTGPCERSFENALFRFAVTRVDREIRFGPDDWDLGFLNSVRFDRHYMGAEQRLRWRLPIQASWQGTVERPGPWVARVTYTGEAVLLVDPQGPAAVRAVNRLLPHYGPPRTVMVPMPAGRHLLRVEYRFDDGSRRDGPAPAGPWATFQVERGRGPEGREPGAAVRAVRPPILWRVLAGAADAAVVALGVPLVLFYLGLLWRDAWLLALVGVAAPLVDRLDLGRVGVPPSLGLCALLAVVAGSALGRRWRRHLLTAYFALLYVTWFVTLRSFRRLDVVTLREFAGDPLSYESHARSILDTWSLEGGERVFFMQPGFRYIRFLERLLLGDGDGLVSLLALTALYWALCWALAWLWPRPRAAGLRAAAAGVTAALLLALWSSPPVVFFVQVSLSEYPTWIFLPLLFPLLFVSRSPRDWRRGGLLVALSWLTRLNHVPALVFLLAVFAWRAWRIRPRAVPAVAGLVLAMALLPAAHNLYYGRQLVWSTLQAQGPGATAIAPRELTRVLRDPEVREKVWYQVDHMFYLHTLRDQFPRGDWVSWGAIRGIQLVWLAVGVLILARRAASGIAAALMALPLVYLGVHLVYHVEFYYPRHVIAGHLAMGLVTLFAVGRGWAGQAGREG
jgi:hypothetical protein